MTNFATGNVRITVKWSDQHVLLEWCGECDARDPGGALRPFFERFLPTVAEKEVRMNFHQLAYMNSSSVSPITQFIRDLATSARKVTVVYDQALQWQATSFRALRVVARKWPNVDVVGS